MNAEEKLRRYADAVVNAPKSLSLTATRDPQEFWDRHIKDALRLLEFFPAYSPDRPLQVLDVGTGNGIPGLPIALLRPSWHVDLLDASNKKIGFIDMIRSTLDIRNVSTSACRAEDMAHQDRRASYDVVTSRALSKLNESIELCSAFIKFGGVLIVPHGTSWRGEIEGSKKTMKAVGVDFEKDYEYNLGENYSFTALLFRKVKETPKEFPRSYKLIKKKPL